jgi:hypothetical protein
MFFSLEVKNLIPSNGDRQQSTMIEVGGTIINFEFSKKYDLSLLPIEGRKFDRCRASMDLQVSIPTSNGHNRRPFLFLILHRARACLQSPSQLQPPALGSNYVLDCIANINLCKNISKLAQMTSLLAYTYIYIIVMEEEKINILILIL